MRARTRRAATACVVTAMCVATLGFAGPVQAAGGMHVVGGVALNIPGAPAELYRNVLVDNAGGHHLALVTAGNYLASVNLGGRVVTATIGGPENPQSGYMAVDPAKDAVVVNDRIGNLTSYSEHYLNFIASRSISELDTNLTVDTQDHYVVASRSCRVRDSEPWAGNCGPHGLLDVWTTPHLYVRKTVQLPGIPAAVAYDPVQREFYVSNVDGTLTVVDAPTLTVEFTMLLHVNGKPIDGPTAMAVDASAHTLYVGTVEGAELTFDTRGLNFFDNPAAGFTEGKQIHYISAIAVDTVHHVAYELDRDQFVDRVTPNVGAESLGETDCGMSWDVRTQTLLSTSCFQPELLINSTSR